MQIGDKISVQSYGVTITGTITQIGHYTGRATQMRRDDNGQLRAILPQTVITPTE